MRILANENVSSEVVSALRAEGFDVSWVRVDAPGTPDPDVLSRAQAEDRTLLTFDKDFGELAFRQGLPSAAGIILLRIRSPSPDAAARTVVAALMGRSDWRGHFAVIEEGRVRMTAMPSPLP